MKRYIEVSQEAGEAFFRRNITGEIVMLNMLKFREVADYSASLELKPAEPITGREAYRKYIEHTEPFLTESGGSLVFIGNGGSYLIGPPDEDWDLVLLVRHKSMASFMAFASDEAFRAGMGHRTAALEDSRLLPLVEMKIV